MTVYQGVLLGLIQGLGEFLPISSSGHLLLVQTIMKIESSDAAMKMFDILLHVGTLIPLLIIFWKDWISMILHPVRNKTLLMLLVASLPTLLVYFVAKKLIVINGYEGFSIFDSGWFLGVSFLITALFLLLCDRVSRQHKEASSSEPNFRHALVMGLFQGIGLVPGVSRSGSTIFGGVLSGLSKEKAARFSFMMSTPAILGSLLIEGKSVLESGEYQIELLPSLAGVLVAAVTGFFAIRFMLKIISRISFGWFALYLAVIGVIWLALQISGAALVPPFAVADPLPVPMG